MQPASHDSKTEFIETSLTSQYIYMYGSIQPNDFRSKIMFADICSSLNIQYLWISRVQCSKIIIEEIIKKITDIFSLKSMNDSNVTKKIRA